MFRRRKAKYLEQSPRSRAQGTARDLPLLLLLASLIFITAFWRLGDATFWDPDEAHYAQTSRELLTTGDWWAPFYNGDPFFDKPVLFHQLQAVAMAVFGPTEFAARLICALAAVALVFVTIWFGAVSSSGVAGLAAGLLLAASPGVFALSRYAILDQLFTAFLFAGAAMLAVAALTNRRHLQWPGYAAIALAVLTKGPLALVLLGLTLILASALSTDARHRLWRLNWMLGLLLILAISLPWFVYMYLRFGQAFVDGYLLDENVRLYATQRFARQPSPLFHVRILAAGLLPWTALAVGRLVDTIRAAMAHERIDTTEVLLWAWVASVVGFFSFSQFKLDHYVWPAAPALYLLCARAWADARDHPTSARHAGARIGLQLVGPLLIVLGVACAYFVVARLELSRGAAVVPAALIGAGGVLSAQMTQARRDGRGLPLPWVALVALGVTYAGVIAFVIPRLEERKVVPNLARWVAADSNAEDPIVAYDMSRWNAVFRFYLNRPVLFIHDQAHAQIFFDRHPSYLCVMRAGSFNELSSLGVPLVVLHEAEGMWVTSGRVLWRRQSAYEKFVVVADARRMHRQHGSEQHRELNHGLSGESHRAAAP